MVGARAAWLSLLGAVAGCALVLRLGPAAGEALASLIGAQRPAAVECVFVAVIYGALLALALIGSACAGVRPFHAFGGGGTALAGTAIGTAGFAAALALATIADSVRPGGTPASGALVLALGALLVLASAGVEEILFRGWLQRVLVDAWGPLAGITVAAAAFAALHIAGGARSPLTMVNLMLGGVLFGLLAWRLGLAAAIGAHGAWNLAERLGVGLDPNPGVGSFGAVLDLDLAGVAAWGGSDEGLNASFAATVALLALLVPLILTRAKPQASPD